MSKKMASFVEGTKPSKINKPASLNPNTKPNKPKAKYGKAVKV